MTIHLVIADNDTLDQLVLESSECSHVDVRFVHHRKAWVGVNMWLFRTPESVTFEEVRDADFRYVDPANYHYIVRIPPNNFPLIAACDLLGVDELWL